MRTKTKAQTTLNQLTGTANKRLNSYHFELRRDMNLELFDKPMLERLRELVSNVSDLESDRNYLRDIKWSASRKESKQLCAQLDKFLEPNHTDGRWLKATKLAKQYIIDELAQLGKVRMMKYSAPDNYLLSLGKTNTHAGMTYIEHGKRLKNEYEPAEIEGMFTQFIIDAKRDRTMGRPILISYRTQCSGGWDEEGNRNGKVKYKTRFVSIVDFMQILAEHQFAGPFQEVLNQSGFYAGAYSDLRLCELITVNRRKHSHWLSIDYSSYDQSISNWIMYEVFDIIRASFVDEGFDDELWDVVTHDFINKVFFDLNGKLVSSQKGIPSGSRFTQIVGTLCNRYMILTYMFAKGLNPKDYVMFIMGDDNLIIGPKIDNEDMSSYINFVFGTDTNPVKMRSGTKHDYPEFLSRIWTPEGADRDNGILIAKLLYPERFRNYEKKDDSGRNIITPDDIIYSYCVTFPVAMTEILDDRIYFMHQYTADGGLNRQGRESATGLDRLRSITRSGERFVIERSV